MQDEFIENLILVKDRLDRQKFFFDEVEDLLFINFKDKSLFNKIHDEDICLEDVVENKYDEQILNQLNANRERSKFL